MKFLVVLSVVALAAALPVPDDCDDALLLSRAIPYGAASFGLGVGASLPFGFAGAAPVAYAAPTPLALPPTEVRVPVTHTHVEVPIHQQVHYGTQAYYAGSSTAIHKPAIAAPAISPPSVLLSKITHNPAELTVKTQEVPVQQYKPNFVETPYHAGTIIEYTEPEVKEVKVATPYAQPVPVPHPVPVAQPVAVPQPVHSVSVQAAAPLALAQPLPLQATAIVAAADDC